MTRKKNCRKTKFKKNLGNIDIAYEVCCRLNNIQNLQIVYNFIKEYYSEL